jgi:hypothetical protein
MDSERNAGGQWPENLAHHRRACGGTGEALSVALSEDFVTDGAWLLVVDLYGASLLPGDSGRFEPNPSPN